MTPIYLDPPRPGYVLNVDLRETSQCQGAQRISFDESAREDLLIKKLGSKGWGRVHHFRNFYQPGWGEGYGQMLSPKAVEAFFRFLETVTFSQEKPHPSVFLTDSGGIELCWEDSAGKAIQFEFKRDGIGFYSESLDREESAGFASISTLAQDFSGT